MKLDDKHVQRAKDIAARDAVQLYMETLQRELRSALLTDANGNERAARETLLVVTGTHMHEAVVVDGSGNAMLIRSVGDIVVDSAMIADCVSRSRKEGTA